MTGGALDGVQLHRVTSFDDLAECRRWAFSRREGPLAFDTESGGLNPYKDRHRLTQLGDLHHGWAFPQSWTGAAMEILRTYPGELLAHNSPYDLRVLRHHAGLVPPWERTHDSLIGCHLADSVRPAGLKPRASMDVDSRASRGEKVMDDAFARQGWTFDTVPEDFEPWWMYGAVDPVLAAHLWRRHSPEIAARFREAYDLERATLRICASMMDTGMMIDRPFIRSKISSLEEYTGTAMAWLRENCGLTSVNSNDQVGTALNNAGVPTMIYTDSGRPSISKAALKYYANAFPQHAPLIQAIAVCRKAEAISGRYLQKFLLLAGTDDVMHYTIWTCKARTTRMSVTDPPMQTYDRDEPAIRGSYIPRPGHVLISIDADQIEARLAAHFSGDRRMIADFLHADEIGVGFFLLMAQRIYGSSITKKDPRYTWTKNATYGQIYGAGMEKAAATAGVPLEQMRPAYSGFRELYPAVGQLMDRLVRENRGRGQRPQVSSLLGRRLYADRGHEYALLNYKIQCSAAEIMKMGLVGLDAAGFGPYLRLPVHDEILAEVPREYARDALTEMTRILTNRTDFAIPITWSGDILEDRWRKT